MDSAGNLERLLQDLLRTRNNQPQSTIQTLFATDQPILNSITETHTATTGGSDDSLCRGLCAP